jgi:hypothetical protein
MDTVIYSATPLKAFSGSLFMLAFLFILGGVGVISAIFSRRDRMGKRIAQGCVSVILLLAGVGGAIATFMTYTGGQTTAWVQVDKKRIVERNCDNASRTCTDYVIEASDGQKYYNFNLGQETWEKIEEQACYKFTYYPAESLLGGYLRQDNEYADLYETTANIAQIEQSGCP